MTRELRVWLQHVCVRVKCPNKGQVGNINFIRARIPHGLMRKSVEPFVAVIKYFALLAGSAALGYRTFVIDY